MGEMGILLRPNSLLLRFFSLYLALCLFYYQTNALSIAVTIKGPVGRAR